MMTSKVNQCDPVAVEIVTEVCREEALLKAETLQRAIFNSADFSSIATDAKGVIQIFNVGAQRMLRYTAFIGKPATFEGLVGRKGLGRFRFEVVDLPLQRDLRKRE